MKQLRLLLIVLPYLFISSANAQNTGAKKTITANPYPFALGKNSWKLERNFSYSTYSTYVNGDKTGHSNSLDLNLEWNRFFWKDFALGLEVDATWAGDHYGNDDLNRSFRATFNATYGRPLSSRVNVYLRGGFGLGSEKEIYKTPGGSTTDKADVTTYRATLGFPILLDNANNSFLTPKVGYRYTSYDYDDGKEKDNRVFVGLHLESYLACDEMGCEHKLGYPFSRNAYNSGSSYIGFTSHGMLAFGNNETTYNGPPSYTQKDKITDGNLDFEYVYYIARGFGLGAAINVNSTVQKSEANDFKYTTTGLSFNPRLVFHPFEEKGVNNFFIQAEGGFGTQKYEYKVLNNTTTNKYSTTNFGGFLGYNAFIAPKLAFTVMLGPEWTTNKEKDTDNKENYREFYVGAGFRKFLGSY